MNKKPKILFLHTLSPGITYWRFINFIKYMKLCRDFEFVIYPEYDVSIYPSPDWEIHFENDNTTYYQVCELCEQADVIITQTAHKYKTLALLDALVHHA